jgi:hypothetical protein
VEVGVTFQRRVGSNYPLRTRGDLYKKAFHDKESPKWASSQKALFVGLRKINPVYVLLLARCCKIKRWGLNECHKSPIKAKRT